MKIPIYLDYQATTPVDPEVFQSMEPYFIRDFGNAASKSHAFGWQAEAAVAKARKQVAECLGASEQEIYFTSGATESNNLAILGIAQAYENKGNHIITGATEHRAVLDPCRFLATKGFRISMLPVDRYGLMDPQAVQEAITPRTILITLMAANNEIGTLHPLREIGEVARKRGIYFHTDAAQAIGKIPFKVNEIDVDLLSLSGHKIYGPKGIGALYLRRKTPKTSLVPIMYGGGHERGLRSGTLNVPGIVGLGAALEIADRKREEEYRRQSKFIDRLYSLILAGLEGVFLNGHSTLRLPNNLNLSFEGVPSEALMMEMRDVAVSSGSACTSANPEPSHVLKAIGLSDALSRCSVRFGVGRFTSLEEVDYAARRVIEAVRKIRENSPRFEESP